MKEEKETGVLERCVAGTDRAAAAPVGWGAYPLARLKEVRAGLARAMAEAGRGDFDAAFAEDGGSAKEERKGCLEGCRRRLQEVDAEIARRGPS